MHPLTRALDLLVELAKLENQIRARLVHLGHAGPVTFESFLELCDLDPNHFQVTTFFDNPVRKLGYRGVHRDQLFKTGDLSLNAHRLGLLVS